MKLEILTNRGSTVDGPQEVGSLEGLAYLLEQAEAQIGLHSHLAVGIARDARTAEAIILVTECVFLEPIAEAEPGGTLDP